MITSVNTRSQICQNLKNYDGIVNDIMNDPTLLKGIKVENEFEYYNFLLYLIKIMISQIVDYKV